MLGFMRLWCAYSGKHEKLEREREPVQYGESRV